LELPFATREAPSGSMPFGAYNTQCIGSVNT
jgi:hypothetical protein